MLTLSIIGLVLGVIDGVSNGLYQGITGTKIKKQVAELRKLIQKDTDLRNQLTEAYNTKNASLAQNIMSSVPGGMANRVAKLEKAVKEQTHAKNIQDLDSNIAKNTNSTEKLENVQMGHNSITNAFNQAEYDSMMRKGSVNPSNTDINAGTFEYTDIYGNKKKGNKEALNKWVYGQDKQTINIKQYKQQPTSNQMIMKGN